uniref:NADH dehydrogenase subunit 6 n=1 Tax=Damon diadema TaxID=317680 RepID=B5U6K9_9ARAC|nr:NADH dehydrogenase subunit 6 [Damon diadema]ACI02277.1 NADH dehydrogenase subunit 6 [Damon diadema]
MISIPLTLAIFFILFHHPISMILTLTLITLSTALIMTSFSALSWFSYILTLVMIGAMLVVFIYLASMAPNETFTPPPLMKTLMLIVIPLMIMLMVPALPTTHKLDPTTTKQIFMSTSTSPNISLAAFLFITMVVVVKITSLTRGPLKSS